MPEPSTNSDRHHLLRYARRVAGCADTSDHQALIQVGMLLTAVLAMGATILITWDVWEPRQQPVNLPLLGLQAMNFGWAMVVGLGIVIWKPRPGVLLYGLLMLAAIACDLYRMQPQFIGLWFLMWACASPLGAWVGRWFLAALWSWAGLHKLLGLSHSTMVIWKLLDAAELDPTWYVQVTIAVVVIELFAAAAAVWWPRAAAVTCLLLHLSILGFLSPWVLDSNSSVWPWNLATAMIGAWLFWQSAAQRPQNAQQWAIVAILLISPATYYFGWLHPRLSHMLYTEHLPKAWHSSESHVRKMHGWGGLKVPFPDSHWTFRQAFERQAAAGDKLAIQDPRWLVSDRFFLKEKSGEVREISRQRFYHPPEDSGEFIGLEGDKPLALFQLQRQQAKITNDESGFAQTVSFSACPVTQAEIQSLAALPNLHEINATDCQLSGSFAALSRLQYLEILDLSQSQISAKSLKTLEGVGSLRWLTLSDCELSPGHLRQIAHLERLEVLKLARTNIDNASLGQLLALKNLQWLDLSGTAVQNIDTDSFGKLVILDLRQTSVSEDQVVAIRQELPQCEVLWSAGSVRNKDVEDD